MDATARRHLRRTVEEHGMLCSVHAPYAADPVSQDGERAIRAVHERFGLDSVGSQAR